MGSLTGWVLIAIIAGVIIILGGAVLPVVVPFARLWNTANADIAATGSPFFQILFTFWPIVLAFPFVLGIVALALLSKSRVG